MAKQAFNDLLVRTPRSMEPFGYKRAQDAGGDPGVESPDNTQMEQDFARLAYMFVQDRAAPLMKYMLGFEVVNREEDGAKAVGLFGFKLGKEYYYVPAFFLNNQIKGVDLLFSKKTNMFVPLQEDWINYIVNRQTIELGGEVQGDRVQRDFENPNFWFLAQPPISPATGLAPKTSEHDVLAKELLKIAGTPDQPWSMQQAWQNMQVQLEYMLEKDASFQEAWGGFVCALSGKPLPFEKTGEDSYLKTWMEKCGGPQAVSAFLTTLTRNPKFANAALTFYPSVESLYVHEFDPKLMPKTAAKVTVTEQVTEYTDGEAKKRLVRDGFTIIDERPEAEKTETYDIDYVKRFSNPEKSGTYQVLLQDGRTTKCWVFLPSTAMRKNATTAVAVVVEQNKKMWRLAEPGAIYVRDEATGDQEKIDKVPEAYDEAIELLDMEFDTKYILIDEKGHATGPVTVKASIAENGKRVKLRVNWDGLYDVVRRPTYGHDFETLHTRSYHNEACSGYADTDYIQLSDNKGMVAKSGTDTLVVPSNWKALKLYDGDDKQTGYQAGSVMRDAFRLGTLVDVEEALTKNAFHKLTVLSDDQGLQYNFRINDNFVTRPMFYKQAYIELVGRFGLSVPDAESMLKQAAADFKCRRLIKLAQQAGAPSSPFVGVSMPQPRDQTPMADPYTGIPVYPTPFEQFQVGTMTGMPPKPNGNLQGINIGGEAEMDQGAQNMAQQAGQLGQKEVFDHSAIGGMSKINDTGAVLDSYVPELMKALDRLGRILFLYYWKNEDFAERYGSNEMPEMEDLARSVFKSFGELVLKLRKKAIDNEDANMVEM